MSKGCSIPLQVFLRNKRADEFVLRVRPFVAKHTVFFSIAIDYVEVLADQINAAKLIQQDFSTVPQHAGSDPLPMLSRGRARCSCVGLFGACHREA